QNIPDQKLDAAAAAILRVASLKQDYQQRIAAAAPTDHERLLNEAVNAMSKAVTEQGLSVDEYDSILEVAKNDPDVRAKILDRTPHSSQSTRRRDGPSRRAAARPSASPPYLNADIATCPRYS